MSDSHAASGFIKRLGVDGVLAVLIYGCTGLLFYPLAVWVFTQTLSQEQLHYPLIVLALGGFLLLTEKRQVLRPHLRHNASSVGLLLATYACVLVSWLLAAREMGAVAVGLVFVGMACYAGSVVQFIFGKKAARVAALILVAFLFFIGMILVLDGLDWRLRTIAGKWSAAVLELLGNSTELFVLQREETRLFLTVNDMPFHVAQECNGFGLLASSLLLTAMLVTWRPIRVPDKLLLLAACVPLALMGNMLRIIVIVTLAPIVGKDNYMLMHEAAGLVFFYGTLVFLWWLISGYAQRERKKAT